MIKGIDPGRRYNDWNLHSFIIEAPKILTDTKREIDSDTIIIGDVSSPMSSTDRSFRQKTETQALNDTLD